MLLNEDISDKGQDQIPDAHLSLAYDSHDVTPSTASQIGGPLCGRLPLASLFILYDKKRVRKSPIGDRIWTTSTQDEEDFIAQIILIDNLLEARGWHNTSTYN